MRPEPILHVKSDQRNRENHPRNEKTQIEMNQENQEKDPSYCTKELLKKAKSMNVVSFVYFGVTAALPVVYGRGAMSPWDNPGYRRQRG